MEVEKVRELLAQKNNALYWSGFDKVSSALRVAKDLAFYPDIDLEAFL